MKWTPISKAKLKFDQDYLITDGSAVGFTSLESTTKTSVGLKHKFKGDDLFLEISHVAVVTLPTNKEE